MALKDLITEKGSLDEAAIERIIGPYVRYEAEDKRVNFMPAFAGLANRAKILVYLVALQGWKFVTDDPIAADARPSDIEAATGIPGGSLRPTLRTLSDNHILSERDSRYSVRGTSLAMIEAELDGRDEGVVVRRAQPSPQRKSTRTTRESKNKAGSEKEVQVERDTESTSATPRRKAGAKTGNLAATFQRWIDEGYFDEPRTLADVQKRFRKEAVIVPQSSLPSYFLGAVRKEQLSRDEIDVGGKKVWAYSTNKKAAK